PLLHVVSVVPGRVRVLLLHFLFDAPPTAEIYTLSLHDALPISDITGRKSSFPAAKMVLLTAVANTLEGKIVVEGSSRVSAFGNSDRKSTRLNSSHVKISYAVFCLKKKSDLLSYPVAH